MLLTNIPFDYAVLLDSSDRLRPKQATASGVRVRRVPGRKA